MLLTFPFNGLFTTQNPEESVLCMSDYVTALLKTLQWIPIEFRWKAKIFIMTDRTLDDHDLLILWPHCLSLLSIFTVVFSPFFFSPIVVLLTPGSLPSYCETPNMLMPQNLFISCFLCLENLLQVSAWHTMICFTPLSNITSSVSFSLITLLNI